MRYPFVKTLMCSVLVGASLSAMADKTITLTNSTLEPITVSTVSNAEPGSYEQLNTTVPALGTADVLLIKDQDETFSFKTSVYGASSTIELVQESNGQAVTAGSYGQDFDLPLSDTGAIRRADAVWDDKDVTIAQKVDGDKVSYVINSKPVVIGDTPANNFNMLVYNAWGITLFGSKKIPERFEQMPEWMVGYDVVVFSELFDDIPSDKLRAAIREDYPYQTGKAFKVGKLLEAGNRIVSRWPIMDEDYEFYNDCNAEQCVASRATIYVKISKMGKPYHIFGTHVQSAPEPENTAARLSQIAQMGDFIRSKNIPADEPILMAGDFNVNKLTVPMDYETMVESLDAIEPANTGFDKTVDSVNNDWVRDPLIEYLDYAFYGRNNLIPLESTQHVFAPRTTADSLWGEWNLSDHYAVLGSYVFPGEEYPARAAFPYDGDAVHFRTHNGHFMRTMSGGDSFLSAGSDEIGTWETYIIEQVSGNKVALKANNGRYVRLDSKLFGTLKTDGKGIGERETFEMIDLGDNRVALKAANGRYLRADFGGGAGLSAGAGSVKGYETFELIRP
ncbi:endonuclease/exonuclease/phosphatase family protein [Parendozoicomonas haliclonae]|uniref:Sphingomyelinase C n=1 Tax=Parendozoicomonas haliclonae TaxID=1960125 RepID=A0A1X7AFF1_9GAMM|nr:endonuclease/exonuclease/phosphatase family protein [Parendozoicomonas haliclonae]SMA37615.1 Sphingomyelinase C precursor [Parendozoicomonas haliclonae]